MMNPGWTITVCLLLLAGCSAKHDAPVSPVAAPHLYEAGDAGPYRLQVGDQVDVQFYKTPELNTRVRVRPDGNVSLQLLDDVRIVGLTPTEVDRRLTELYGSELRAPQITVSVVDYGARRIYVGGEVGSPGMLRLDGPLSAFQAVQQAGGFIETAALDGVVLIRRGPDGRPHGVELNLEGVADGSDVEADVALQSQDIVFVPRSRIADINLWVDQYIRKNLPVTPSFGIGLGVF